jgi:hypothetical protein
MDIFTFLLSLGKAKKYTDGRVQALEGRGGYLTAYDFGTSLPTQDALTQYALGQIKITNPVDIWNGTHVRNLYIDPSTIDGGHPDGIIDGRVWALTNTPDTDPPIFEWVDDGPEGVGQATNRRYGLVKGAEDPGDGSADGDVTIQNGKMKTLGFAGLKDKVAAKQDKIAAGTNMVLSAPDKDGGAPAVLPLSGFVRPGVPFGVDDISSSLIIQPVKALNYNQGMRINHLQGWAGIVLGGRPGSTENTNGNGYDADQSAASPTRKATWWIASNPNGDLVLQQSATGSRTQPPAGLYLTRDGKAFIGLDDVQQLMTRKVIDDGMLYLDAYGMSVADADPGLADAQPFYTATPKACVLKIDTHNRTAYLNGYLNVGKSFTGGFDIPYLLIPRAYLPDNTKSLYLMGFASLHNTASAKRMTPAMVSFYLGLAAPGTAGSVYFLWRFGKAGEIPAETYNEVFINHVWKY